ncbi:MAG TPA: hypothetical protein VHC18_09920 [Amycolatopsis sp.]|nr:hypothetical protein [Amycolatopsis sp.]
MRRGLRGSLLGVLGVVTLAIPAAACTTPAAPAPPPAAPPPVVPGCEQGCETVFSDPLDGGRRLDALQHEGTGSVLAYWDGAHLLDTTPVLGTDGHPYDHATGGLCGRGRCSVTFEYGVHSAAVAAIRLDSKITVTGTAEGVVADAHDLNGDGVPDAAIRQSTYEPSFATAPLYWMTYLQQGDQLVPTGCTTPVQGQQPAPAAPATGACPGNI